MSCEEIPEKEESSENDNWEWEEFTEFCQHLADLRSENANKSLEELKECTEYSFDDLDLQMLFVLMLMIAHGAFVRTVLRYFNSGIPYTVILMLSGLIVGFISRYQCKYVHTYTAIARISPKIILFVFLPVLIFESAFSITPHIFVRSLCQILVVAFPGMLVATGMTAVTVIFFFNEYHWCPLHGLFFGSIISATDPVAVVAILRELGTSETLSVIIEGESLLNDGVAILLYEVIEKILTREVDKEMGIPLFILIKFCQITLGGPLFGWIMGKIAIFCLSIIFNDATVEITITLVAAYLTYYIGEDLLHVSGVMAVVVLGITMGSERTAISPEVESFVHHFWEMLGYLANTVLFMIVGIVITETAIVLYIDYIDYIYLGLLYIMLNLIRLLMLILAYPLISRIGYGLNWQSLIVMTWGGLRGAVGICLALDVYDNRHLCQTKLGPRILFQTAGIVFLTLVINGTTTKGLLKMLKLTDISAGRILDMANAMKQLEMAQLRTISMLKHDRFVSDASWVVVTKNTSIKNPYLKKKGKSNELPPAQSLVSVKKAEDDHHTECPDCHAIVVNEPSTLEYAELTEEARLRILKALKVSFWRQFEQGILIELAVQILVNVTAAAEDKPLRLIHAYDLRKYWNIHGCLPWMKTKFTKRFGLDEEQKPPVPKNQCRRGFWWLATRDWFDYIFIGIVLLNMVPAIWEIVILVECNKKFPKDDRKREKCVNPYTDLFLYCSIIFIVLYIMEMLIKITGRGFTDYFCVHKCNYIDIFVVVIGVTDIVLTLCDIQVLAGVGLIKIFRIGRLARLLRPLVPKIMKGVDRSINKKLFLGYDVGKGFITAVDDVAKFLPQMVEHPKVYSKLKHSLEKERLETIREMGIMQKDHPGIAIAVKTRHASRAVLNQMRDTLLELKEDGLVDEKECDLLMLSLEQKMKRLWDSPPSIPPAPPESLLGNVTWLHGLQELYDFIHQRAELVTFPFGETICKAGDPPNGIFIITSGMVKIHYIPTDELIQKFEEDGEIPNMELFVDLTFRTKEDDFFSTGTVIGEKSVLTGQLRAATVKCETSVFAYHITQSTILEAMQKFDDAYDSLESRMWRAIGMKLALAVLPRHQNFASWGIDKIRLHCERSCVPIGERFNVMTVPNFVSDILVIQGKVKDGFSNEIFRATQLIPRNVSKIHLNVADSKVQARILVIAHDDSDTMGLQDNNMSLQQLIEVAVEQAKHPVNTENGLPTDRRPHRYSHPSPEAPQKKSVGSMKSRGHNKNSVGPMKPHLGVSKSKGMGAVRPKGSRVYTRTQAKHSRKLKQS